MMTYNRVRMLRDATQVVVKLQFFRRNAPAVASKILIDDAYKILHMSQAIVPFKEGHLHDTGRVEKVQVGDVTRAYVAYGSATVLYARVQHDRMDLVHAPGRRAKYLEGPAYQVGQGTTGRIKQAILEGRLI